MVSTTMMAALVIVALFWGNCFSCPQTLLALQSHGCCHPAKPTPSTCQSQGLKSFEKAESGVQVDPGPVVAAIVEPVLAVSLFTMHVAVISPTEHTPPEILSLRI
jgi:hypothetical protein